MGLLITLIWLGAAGFSSVLLEMFLKMEDESEDVDLDTED